MSDVPKPLAPVSGRPFLAWVLDNLNQQGVRETVLAVGYKASMIMGAIGNQWDGMRIAYSVEDTPLGTGGAIHKALSATSDDDVLILNGDTFLEVDLHSLFAKHQKSGRKITLTTSQILDSTRYGSVELGSEGDVIAFHEKGKIGSGKINGGIYAIDRKIMDHVPPESAFSFESEFLITDGPAGKLGSFPSNGLFIDIGVPEDYKRAQSIFPIK